MEIAPLLHLWPVRLVSHSCSKSSTLRSESGKRTYSITASRMTSGLVLPPTGAAVVADDLYQIDLDIKADS